MNSLHQKPIFFLLASFRMKASELQSVNFDLTKIFVCYLSWTSWKVKWVFIRGLRCIKKGHMSRDMTTNKMSVRPAKTQISLGIRPVWSEYSLSAWRKFRSLATHWAHSEDSDQTGRMPRLIWVFAGCTVTLLVLSCRGSDKLSIRHRKNVLKWSCKCFTATPHPIFSQAVSVFFSSVIALKWQLLIITACYRL